MMTMLRRWAALLFFRPQPAPAWVRIRTQRELEAERRYLRSLRRHR